jgi:hypothetical protein
MADQNRLRLFHVFVSAASLVVLFLWLAVHLVAWYEPGVPIEELYAIYFPFEVYGHLTFLLFQVGLFTSVVGLFPNHPARHYPYYVIIVFFLFYYFHCHSQCQGNVRHTPAGWWYAGKHGGFQVTEEQAFHGMWRNIKAESALGVGFGFLTSYVLVGSCVLTSRITRQEGRKKDIR